MSLIGGERGVRMEHIININLLNFDISFSTTKIKTLTHFIKFRESLCLRSVIHNYLKVIFVICLQQSAKRSKQRQTCCVALLNISRALMASWRCISKNCFNNLLIVNNRQLQVPNQNYVNTLYLIHQICVSFTYGIVDLNAFTSNLLQ